MVSFPMAIKGLRRARSARYPVVDRVARGSLVGDVVSDAPLREGNVLIYQRGDIQAENELETDLRRLIPLSGWRLPGVSTDRLPAPGSAGPAGAAPPGAAPEELPLGHRRHQGLVILM